jgi:Fe-S cluster assembly protein SufD
VTSDTVVVDRLAQTVEELSRELGEPDWLVGLRARAARTYEAMPLPTQHTEGWRRTSLSGLPLSSLSPSFGRLPEADERIGSIVPVDFDKFSALHYALLDAVHVVLVPRNKVLEEPIWLKHDAAFGHTLIILDEGAQATVVEECTGEPALASGVVEQVLGPNANLRYVQLQRWSPQTWSFSTQSATLAQDAHLRTLNVALGARLARNNVQVALNGRGSQADLLGVVAGDERQHVDFQTLQDHFGDATRSDLVIHNALRGRSSANFTGLIRINKSAHQTESSQEQKNILLSPRSKADSDPKLEILNNDVIRCTHGAAVGPVDLEALFYLESRGLDRLTAERLIVEGFFQSVLARLDAPAVQDELWKVLA